MKLLLIRCMSGKNEIVRITDTDAKVMPGVEPFDKFIRDLGLFSHEFALELGQVLKIPCEKIVKLGDEGGFIDGDAKRNILAYLQVRIPPVSIQFLQCQSGEVGESNGEYYKG